MPASATCSTYQGLSGLTGFSKPDPRAFQAAAEALGVTPADCIMVGDRIDNDIAPAKALGMAAILLRGGRHRRQRPRSPAEEPDAVVTDVLELEAAIDDCSSNGRRTDDSTASSQA